MACNNITVKMDNEQNESERGKIEPVKYPVKIPDMRNVTVPTLEQIDQMHSLSRIIERERLERKQNEDNEQTGLIPTIYKFITGVIMRNIKTTIAAGVGFVVLLLSHFAVHVPAGLEQALVGVSAWVIAIFSDVRDWRTILTGAVGTLAYLFAQFGVTLSPDVQIVVVGIILQLTGLGASDQPSHSAA